MFEDLIIIHQISENRGKVIVNNLKAQLNQRLTWYGIKYLHTK